MQACESTGTVNQMKHSIKNIGLGSWKPDMDLQLRQRSWLRRQGLNRGSYDNTVARGKKDHEKHVPSSEALTWVQSQSTLLCHIKRPRQGPVVSTLTPSPILANNMGNPAGLMFIFMFMHHAFAHPFGSQFLLLLLLLCQLTHGQQNKTLTLKLNLNLNLNLN
ncbi:hypothetical protein VNO78_23663 [Psophocarpus tetragonolobus]|uniref:Uncharacterized protein n=1 Tax=Psophocarpus tetragonolobus TaxID=3891 RepID=A0AAN9S4E1_PSOTE